MKLEHANITVADIDRATAFLQQALPEVHIRGGGPRAQGGRWLHIGSDDSYIALQEDAQPQHSNQQTYVHIGINHLSFVVDDIKAVFERLSSAGYRHNDVGVEEVGRSSAYFYDDDGLEWEFVQYHSNDPAVRNAY